MTHSTSKTSNSFSSFLHLVISGCFKLIGQVIMSVPSESLHCPVCKHSMNSSFFGTSFRIVDWLNVEPSWPDQAKEVRGRFRPGVSLARTPLIAKPSFRPLRFTFSLLVQPMYNETDCVCDLNQNNPSISPCTTRPNTFVT